MHLKVADVCISCSRARGSLNDTRSQHPHSWTGWFLNSTERPPEGAPGVVGARHVETAMAELHGESGEEDEEEHDQHPLAAGCLHVEALGHQGEICARRVKG